MTYLDGTLRIGTDHRLFELTRRLTTNLAALGIATKLVGQGRQSFKRNEYGLHGFPRGHDVMISCEQFDVEVCLPLSGPIESMVLDLIPDTIEITFRKSKNENQTGTTVKNFQDGIMGIFIPLYVQFFEDNRPWIAEKYSAGPHEWPAIWNFGRVIRNAMSHRGIINILNKNSPPVTWYKLKYSTTDNGKKIIGTDLSFGDIIILIHEMNDILDNIGCPKNIVKNEYDNT